MSNLIKENISMNKNILPLDGCQIDLIAVHVDTNCKL